MLLFETNDISTTATGNLPAREIPGRDIEVHEPLPGLPRITCQLSHTFANGASALSRAFAMLWSKDEIPKAIGEILSARQHKSSKIHDKQWTIAQKW